MRLGMSITSGHPDVAGVAAVRNVIERARVAGASGLDHLSLGDHHAVGPAGNYVQNVPTIGRILADWPADRPIGLLLLLPLWNPVLAAEQVGTLACMSDAKFIVQTGIGYGRSQFQGMGAPTTERGDRTDAAISLMKALFAGERVDAPTFGVTQAAISPRPHLGVDWWIGSGTGPRPLERAAREGSAWYVSPGLPIDALTEAIVDYRQRCASHGTLPRVAVRRDVLVGRNHGQTVALGQRVAAAGYRGMDPSVLVAGGVAAVAEELANFAAAGVDDIVARTITVPQDVALESIEALGDVREQLRSGSS